MPDKYSAEVVSSGIEQLTDRIGHCRFQSDDWCPISEGSCKIGNNICILSHLIF